MPRYTTAYTNLIERFSEVNTILRRARQVSNQTPTPDNISLVNALCRSGVVLLSSHIEGYISEVGELALNRIVQKGVPKARLGTPFRYYLSRDLIKQIKETTDPSNLATHVETLFARDSHVWDTHPVFAGSLSKDVFLGDFANPKHDRIKKFFKRFGYEEYEGDLARRLTRDFRPCSNMVNRVVDQRNAIAHGDMLTIGTPYDLNQMIALTRQYCREADHVVGGWFKAQRCPIR